MSSPWQCGYVCEDLREETPKPVKWGCCIFFTIGVLITVIVVIASSLESIESTDIGITYDSYQAILKDEKKEEGLHTKPTFGKFILWPKTHKTMTQKLNCLSQDGVTMEVSTSFQFTPDPLRLFDLTKTFVDYDGWRKILSLSSRSGIRTAAALFSAQQFQTQRAAVQTKMLEAVKASFKKGQLHAFVIELQVTNLERPKNYEAAVDAKEAAKNEIETVKNARIQQVVKANTKLMKVKVTANKTIDTATTQAAITTRTAAADAAVVKGRYASLGKLYKGVRTAQGLSSEGLLAYIGTRLVDELNSITVGLPSPARVSYLTNTTAA